MIERLSEAPSVRDTRYPPRVPSVHPQCILRSFRSRTNECVTSLLLNVSLSSRLEFGQFPSRFRQSDGRGHPSYIVARASPPALLLLNVSLSSRLEFGQFPSRFRQSDGRGRPSHIVARASPPALAGTKSRHRTLSSSARYLQNRSICG
jgi:hypothetical protein